MSNKQRKLRSRRNVHGLYTKFSNDELTKVRQELLKSQDSFLLKQDLIKHHKDTFGSNYMDPVKCGNTDKDELTEGHDQCDSASVILSSCTEGKKHKTFFEINKKVEIMNQEAWMKAEDHVTVSLHDDQVLTIENTDQDIKKYETYVARMIDTKTTFSSCRHVE